MPLPTPSRFSRSLLVAALAAACAACAPADGPAPSAPANEAAPQPATAGATTPSSPDTIDDAAVSAFLVSIYGAGARTEGEWTHPPADAAFRAEGEADSQVTRTVCAREPARVGGRPALLLAVCGAVQDAGHPAAGTNDFFLLQGGGDKLAATASAHMAEFGSRGAPGKVEAARLGADLYGFVVESGFYNMGQGVQTRHVVLPKQGAFADAGWFNASLTNEDWIAGCRDSGQCTANDAYAVDFEFAIDDTDAGAKAYPLLVREKGTACGKPADARYRLELDPASMTYAVPAALQRQSCADAG